MSKIKDIDIRKAFIKEFREELDELFISEYSLGNNIADIIAIKDELIHVYEIKSEVDTLNRLEKQLETYQKIAHKVTIIIHEKHFEHLMKSKIPLYYPRIIIAKGTKDRIVFDVYKEYDLIIPDIGFILTNCWKEDLVRIGQDYRLTTVKEYKHTLCKKLETKISLEDAIKVFKNRLKKSYIKKCLKCNSQFVRNTSDVESYIQKGSYNTNYRITEKMKYQECFECGNEQNHCKYRNKTFVGHGEFK